MKAGRDRVLVVDDQLMNLKLVRILLERKGFEVCTAIDAPSALVEIEARRPDLILMDIQLPGMNGLDLTQMLKGDPATRGIVIVAFTAYAMKGDEDRMRAAGCDGYIPKPIDTRTFSEQVGRHLEQIAV